MFLEFFYRHRFSRLQTKYTVKCLKYKFKYDDVKYIKLFKFIKSFVVQLTNFKLIRFSIGQLPLWAKKHISEDTSPPISLNKGVAQPKGRWAQRAERTVDVKSFYSDSVISFPNLNGKTMHILKYTVIINIKIVLERIADSGGSKDSSLDSGTDSRQYSEIKHKHSLLKQVG